ncbi:hypothetical protein [Spirulina major]|uniref:hypothetical protein n=1 Tax=Spirulina major TaxID=270636 RepID=UPI0009323CD2|nr:hypothetical protein [Spirulina major]
MTAQPLELEGTWEEIVSHSEALAGCQVRVTVLFDPHQSPTPKRSPRVRSRSGRSLLRHAGTWSGDDLKDCLNTVYETRHSLEF